MDEDEIIKRKSRDKRASRKEIITSSAISTSKRYIKIYIIACVIIQVRHTNSLLILAISRTH